MPFKSKAQAKWMFSNKPEMAKKWASHTKDMKKLPVRLSAKSPRKNKKPKMKGKRAEKVAEKMIFGGSYSK